MFHPKTPQRPNEQSANMAHFEAFYRLSGKYTLVNSPRGGRGMYMVAKGLIV